LTILALAVETTPERVDDIGLSGPPPDLRDRHGRQLRHCYEGFRHEEYEETIDRDKPRNIRLEIVNPLG
jgi:hypothetical protein